MAEAVAAGAAGPGASAGAEASTGAGAGASPGAGASAGAEASTGAGASSGTGASVGAGGREPPPAGWQSPASESSADPDGDLDALVLLLLSLRDLIPLELQRRLIEALRELLHAIRALIDWYLERLEHPRAEPAEVQDIPIL
jgi:hypothetical protein